MARLSYQLDFVTPGIWPSSASFRKQIRHKPNFRMKPRGRPHRSQRFRCRTGCAVLKALGCFAFMIIETFAIYHSPTRMRRAVGLAQATFALAACVGQPALGQ
jgi:hypothetical protein